MDSANDIEGRTRTASELATIYAHRHRGLRGENLEVALRYAEEAAKGYEGQEGSPAWSLAQLRLGNLYCDLLSGDRSANIAQAIASFEKVLDHSMSQPDQLMWAQAQNNLGTAYATKATSVGDAAYQKARDCFERALKVYGPTAMPAQARMAAANWGDMAFEHGAWAEAWQAYGKALQATQLLYEVGSTERGRRVELAEHGDVPVRAAESLLRMRPPRVNEAIEVLEQSRAHIIGDALARDRAALDKLPEEQQSSFRQARERVRTLEAESRAAGPAQGRSFLRISKELGQARSELQYVINEIRAAAPHFMATELTVAEIRSISPPSSPLVYLFTTGRGTLRLLCPTRHALTRPWTKHVW